MNTAQELELIKCLIRCYFDTELQNDETPAAAKKRVELLKSLLEMAEK